MKHIIKWHNYTRYSYLFGSTISFQNKRVLFENALMPSGTVVNEWQSKTNFQAHRIVPDLPMLKCGYRYTIGFQATSIPESCLYLGISFKDQYNHEIDFMVIKSLQESFVYPEGAASYTVQLINAGSRSFVFDYITIEEEDTKEVIFSTVTHDGVHILFPNKSETLNVVFMEDAVSNIEQEHVVMLRQLGNVVLMNDYQESENCYLNKICVDKMTRILIKKGYHYINFVGMGDIGNLAALQFAHIFKRSRAYITKDMPEPEVYKQRLYRNNVTIKTLLDELFILKDYDSRIRQYGDEPKGLQLCRKLYQNLDKLKKLPIMNEVNNG